LNRTSLELGFHIAGYIWSKRLSGERRFPIVTMLEPLETCNLCCSGCGRVREYRETVIDLKKMVSVDKCLEMTKLAGAPVVSIAGGEPLIHPQIDQIVAGIINQKRFVYLCTNGLLMEQAMEKIKPSKYFCWVVHLDGMEEQHDHWVGRKGVWDKAVHGIKRAQAKGYRVCTNTTIFNESDLADLHALFQYLTELDIEGLMISAGFSYTSIQKQDVFLERQRSAQLFKQILDPTKRYKFYNNPLYLEFLRGEREYLCQAWTNPTYTPLGWRKPCYLLVDEHTERLEDLYNETLWADFGVGNDPRCASCTMHSGFEGGIIQHAFTSPAGFASLVKSFLRTL
jgi:hopanoid biosynthesis associated radical SAM protein HpnH